MSSATSRRSPAVSAALAPHRGGGGMGAFAGVFTPSVLTILGIILFRRLGFVVGSAGLAQALAIILVANVISVLTSFSLAAIATNLRVKSGGDYYIISRTLGVEFGGAIGIVLFAAQTISIAFYCIGFGEVVTAMLPWSGEVATKLVATAALLLLFGLAWLGADCATRFQYVVMAILVAALAAFFIGGLRAWDPERLAASWRAPAGGMPFWAIFAIFFPAVTGFTQGVSLSGELRDPGRSLPLGTFAAVAVSIVVYVVGAVLFAAGLPLPDMQSDYGAMNRLSAVGWLIDAGVVAATLSSAMASFLGAPRILQALAKDRIFPALQPFAHGHGATDNPRRGVWLCLVIALVTTGLGQLNMIAPIVAMFFLISYGLLNYATWYEARAASPSFRPRFRWFHRRLSLLGALGCLGVMLAISPTAGIVAVALLFAVYQYTRLRAGPARWADSSRSFMFQRIREHLFAMDEEPKHARDWRPEILAFSSDPGRRERLLRFASWIEGDSGLTTAVTIVERADRLGRDERRRETEALREQLEACGSQAFPLVVSAPSLHPAFDVLLQAYGIGPLKANIVLLNWLDQRPDAAAADPAYGGHLREALRYGCSIVVVGVDDDDWSAFAARPINERRIDVWWWNSASSRLGLLLAYLMTRSNEWQDASLRVVAPAVAAGEAQDAADLKRLLDEFNIAAEPEIVDSVTADIVAERSADAAMVFLPMNVHGAQLTDPFGGRLEDLFPRLPMAATTLASADIELALEPDDATADEPPPEADSPSA